MQRGVHEVVGQAFPIRIVDRDAGAGIGGMAVLDHPRFNFAVANRMTQDALNGFVDDPRTLATTILGRMSRQRLGQLHGLLQHGLPITTTGAERLALERTDLVLELLDDRPLQFVGDG